MQEVASQKSWLRAEYFYVNSGKPGILEKKKKKPRNSMNARLCRFFFHREMYLNKARGM